MDMNLYRRRGLDRRYPPILADLQAQQNEIYWQLNADNRGRLEQSRDLILPFIVKFIQDGGYSLDGYSDQELAGKLYHDLKEQSILTVPLHDSNVEGIRIDAWNNVTVDFANGQSRKIDGFNSPQHAIDVINTRLLQNAGKSMDDARPTAEASLGTNVRITAVKSPVVDSSAGVSCYIRRLSGRVFTQEEYLTGGFVDPRELESLRIMLRRGCSILIVGKVNTGKTTLLSYLLSSLPDEMQIITIEGGAREMDLVRCGESGEPVNNVIHLLTRESAIPEESITQEALVEKALRMNPDVIGVAEMRNLEAHAAVEASLSGHMVVSTVHAGSPQQAHKRVASLCRKKYALDYRTALEQACEAFPLVVFIHTLEDGNRRIMNISECKVDNGVASYLTLWEYQVEENISGATVRGKHRQLATPTDHLVQHMKMYGIGQKELGRLREGG